MAGTSYHVVPNKNEWAVTRENSMRSLKTFSTKAQAKKFAWQEAQQRKGSVVMHKSNGKIQTITQPERGRYDATQHVVPHERGWAVYKANSERATSVYNNKMSAISRAKTIARNQDSQVVIHDSEGLIRYTGDPRAFLEVSQGVFA